MIDMNKIIATAEVDLTAALEEAYRDQPSSYYVDPAPIAEYQEQVKQDLINETGAQDVEFSYRAHGNDDGTTCFTVEINLKG